MLQLSIIIPVYNLSTFVGRCIDSVCAHESTDFEVICINDGSTDNSFDVLQDYASRDNRIVVLNQKNAGVSSARNTGLSHARGRFVSFIDADDTVTSAYIPCMLSWCNQNNVDVVVFSAELQPPVSWMANMLKTKSALVQGKNAGMECLFRHVGCLPFICNKLYRRSLICANHIQFEDSISLGEDNAFQFLVFPNAHTVLFSPKKLYIYHTLRSNSAVTLSSQNTFQRLKAHINLLNYISLKWNELGLLKKNKSDLLDCLRFLFDSSTELSFPDFRRFSVLFLDTFSKWFSEQDITFIESESRDFYRIVLLAATRNPLYAFSQFIRYKL